MVPRRAAAAVTALILVAEAVGIGFVNMFLGMVVDDQQMSLAGLEPRAMTVSTWIAGAVFGVYLVVCALVLLHTALRDSAPVGFRRILLISCAVIHGVLGAATAGIVGWAAFVWMMAQLALLVFTLVWYGAPPAAKAKAKAEAEAEAEEQGADAGGDGTRPEPAA